MYLLNNEASKNISYVIKQMRLFQTTGYRLVYILRKVNGKQHLYKNNATIIDKDYDYETTM